MPRPMMMGPTSDAAVPIPMAKSAMTTRPFSGCISGTKRLMPALSVFFWPGALEVSRVYFIEISAPLRFVNLDVFRRRIHQGLVRAGGQHLAFHQQNNLVVILDGRDLLRHRNQGNSRVIVVNIVKDGA